VMSGFLDSGLKLHVAALRFWATSRLDRPG
jgi:hypothetical protein